MGDYGLKISKPGNEITSPNENDYIMWSKYPYMKTYLVGTTSYSFGSDVDDVVLEITHDLNYYPMAWVTIEGPNSEDKTWNWWAYWYSSGGHEAYRSWGTEVTHTKLKIHYEEALQSGDGYDPTGEDWYFKYYIFIDLHLGGG